MGELRRRVRHRSTRGSRRQRKSRRVGLRGLVAHARQPSGERHARQRHHGNAGRPPAGGLRSSRPRVRAGRIQQWQQRCAVVRRRLRGRPVWRRRHDPQRARAVAHDQVFLLHRAAAIARAPPEYVRPRELHGRDRRCGESGSRRVPAAPSESSAIDRRVEGGDEGGELGCTAVAEAGHSPNRRRHRSRRLPRARTKATTDIARWSPKSPSIRIPAP